MKESMYQWRSNIRTRPNVAYPLQGKINPLQSKIQVKDTSFHCSVPHLHHLTCLILLLPRHRYSVPHHQHPFLSCWNLVYWIASPWLLHGWPVGIKKTKNPASQHHRLQISGVFLIKPWWTHVIFGNCKDLYTYFLSFLYYDKRKEVYW